MKAKILYKALTVPAIMAAILVLSSQAISAATLEEQLNNLTGPTQQYNTMLSPAYLRNNTSEEAISPQSGDISLAQTDYVLPGVNGLDLEIKRIYKSGSANVREMKAEYINGVWVDQVYSDNNTSSFYEDRYNLGIGMRFSFPAMEIRKNQDGTSYKFLHTEAGDVYRLYETVKDDGALAYMPDNQTIKDVVISETGEFSNGQEDGTSFYVMSNKTGKKTYFSEDGRVLGIVDRYGSKITFEYLATTYTVDGNSKTQKLLSKITDTMGREVSIEYKQDQSFTVGPVQNNTYTANDSYKASQNPNTTDSGDLKEKFQVVISLPNGQKIIYDKSAVLVSSSKHVVRTRLQRVFDIDGKPKYHFWYDQPELGFTYTNGTSYSAYNRYENLTQIDYCKTNRLERFSYSSYARQLSEKGSMQYRKVFEKKELEKTGFDSSRTGFLEAFICTVKDRDTYKYTNEADGFGYGGYTSDDAQYLENTYRYYTEKTDFKNTVTKYTYNGIHEQVNTEELGADHRSVSVTEYDEMKFPMKVEKTVTGLEKGQVKGQPVKRLENFRYDMYGNMTSYTGPVAQRDEKGYPLNDENTVNYTYDYDRYHVLSSKTWSQSKGVKSQIIYTVDDRGNVIKEQRVHSNEKARWLVTDFEYDSCGNMTRKTVHSDGQDFITKYEYGADADGADQKGAYLTRQYSVVEGAEVSKSFAYDFNTGNLKAELDGNSNRTDYEYDALSRIKKITYPDKTLKQYTYNDYSNKNSEIEYVDPSGTRFRYEYDTAGLQVEYSVLRQGEWKLLLKYEYDFRGNKQKELDANGNSVRFEYDSQNLLVKKEYYEQDTAKKEAVTLAYTYGPDAGTYMLAVITDEDGYDRRLYYDALNKLVRSEVTPDKLNYHASAYAYNLAGSLESETDARGNATSYAYDDLGRLTGKKDALNNETLYFYNSLDKIEAKEEPGGRRVSYKYDTAGRTVEERVYEKAAPEDYTYKSYTYDNNSNMLSIEQGRSQNGKAEVSAFVEYVYDSMDRPLEQRSKIDETRMARISYTYDARGNKKSVTEYIDEAGSSKILQLFDYDFGDRIIRDESVMQVGPEEKGHCIRSYGYDMAGNKTLEEIFNGTGYDTTTIKYDYRNRPVEKKEPFETGKYRTTKYSYDKRGNLASETLSVASGESTSQYRYDGIGKLIVKIDPMGYISKYAYDQNGNLVKEVDPRYSSQAFDTATGIEYEYDALNRPVRTSVYDGGTRTVTGYKEYDGRGNVIKTADGEGYNRENPSASHGELSQYDYNNNVILHTSAQTAYDNEKQGKNNYTKKYTYDGSGRMLTETDTYGNTTAYVYYLSGLLKRTAYPDGASESYEYDLTGKQHSVKTDKAGNKTASYSNLFGKPYRVEYPDATAETLEYSPRGELVKSVDKAGNAHYYTYNPGGNLTDTREYAYSDASFDYYRHLVTAYDETGRTTSTETFLYKTAKNTLSQGQDKSTGDRVSYVYDKNGKLIRTEGPGGRETVNEYDKAGNLLVKRQKIKEEAYNEEAYEITRYKYDIQSRLTEEALLVDTSDLEPNSMRNVEFDSEYSSRVKAKTSYTYYKNGQLKARQDANGNASRVEYDLDRQPVRKTDALGNTVTYIYDLRGRLLEEKNAKGIATFYDYDAMNRLVRRRSPAAGEGIATTRYIYDVMGNLIKQIEPNSYEAAKDTQELAQTMSGRAYTYDSMNRLLTTLLPDGRVVEYLKYDALGNVVKRVDGLRFSGSIEASAGTEYLYNASGRLIKTTDALGSSKSYEYDILGNLTRATDQRNNSTAYTYNADGTLSGVHYADGGEIAYTYDLQGRMLSQRNQLGNLTKYDYNSFGGKKSETDAYGYSLEYRTDLKGNVVTAKDKAGSITYVTYDVLDRPVRKRIPLEKDGSGNIQYAVEGYTYDQLGNILTKTYTGTKDKLSSRTESYTYYDNGLTNTVSSTGGDFVRSHYDRNGNVIKTESLRAEGVYDIRKFEYDALNRLVKDIRLADTEDIYEASKLPNIEALKDPEYADKLRLVTQYEYDMLGNKIKVYSPQAFAYDEGDIAGRAAYTTVYAYDALSRLERVSWQQEGREVSTRYSYDGAGNRIAETDGRGFTAKSAYDALNRLETLTDPQGNTLTYTYDLAGNKLSEKNAKGDTVSYAYDRLNRLKTVTDAYDRVVSGRVYDANGNVTKETDAQGYSSGSDDAGRYGTVYTYDLAGRLTSRTTPEAAAQGKISAKYEYNQYGEMTRQTDALGSSITYEYSAGGYLAKVTDALGAAVKYSYDKLGNKLSMTDGRGKLTRYAYTALGALKSVTNAENKAQTYRYDLEGNLALITDKNGNNTVYTYDSTGNLLERRVKETGDSIGYTYDEAGNRTSMTDESGRSTYSYDKNGRLLEIRKGSAVQLSYEYDRAGNISRVTDLKDRAVSYTYDRSNRMSAVASGGKTTSYTYDENGRRTAVEYEGGVSETYTYDRDNQLVRLVNKKPGGAVLSEYSYTYDLAGRQTAKTDSFGTTEYTYDKAGRVLRAAAPGKLTVYAYDSAGNRVSQNETYTSQQPSGYVDGGTGKDIQYILKKSDYAYSSANLLLRLTERLLDSEGRELARKLTKYVYDDNGNQLRQSVSHILPDSTKLRPSTKGTAYGDELEGEIDSLIEKTSYTYDGFNRLTDTETIKAGERTTAEYTYDGDDLRVSKTVRKSGSGYKAEVTNYLYDRQNVILETDADGNTRASYVKGINYISKTDGTGKDSYYLFNGHGDVVQTVDAAGSTQNQYEYDIWGNPVLTIEASGNAIRYAGEFLDSETGLYYLRARFYDPYLGRFTTEDSYWGEDENPLSLNLYTYCANDPVRYVDPSGHVTMYNSAGKPCEVDPREVGGAEQVGFTLTAPSVTMYKVAEVSVWNADASRATFTVNGITKSLYNEKGTIYNGDGNIVGSSVDGHMTMTSDWYNSMFGNGTSTGSTTVNINQSVTSVRTRDGSNVTVNVNGGTVTEFITGDNSHTVINNRSIIETITTGKSSSLVLNNSGTINQVRLGENGTAEIYNAEGRDINNITGGDITDGSRKGMYIENRGTIVNVLTGKNSRNTIDNLGGHLTLETGEENETIVINGQKGITHKDGKGKTYLRLYNIYSGAHKDIQFSNTQQFQTGIEQMLKGGWSFDKPAWLVQEEKVKAEIDKYYNDAMKYYNNPDNNWFIPYRKGVKELWEFIDLVANEYGLNEYDVKLLKADAVFCSDNTIQEMSAQHYIRNHPREGLEGLALVMLTPRLSSNNSALKTRTKIEDDFKGFNFGNKEVYNSAKTPRTGAEWNEYFKSKYGEKNVTWETNKPDVWGNWNDYFKVDTTGYGKEYALINGRLYSKHAVDRMQPSGNRYGSQVYQAGGDYGRGVSPQYVETVINSTKPVLQENGNLSYTSGSLQIITNQQGAVVTVMTK